MYARIRFKINQKIRLSKKETRKYTRKYYKNANKNTNKKWLIIICFNLEIKRRKFGNLEEKEHFNNKNKITEWNKKSNRKIRKGNKRREKLRYESAMNFTKQFNL